MYDTVFLMLSLLNAWGVFDVGQSSNQVPHTFTQEELHTRLEQAIANSDTDIVSETKLDTKTATNDVLPNVPYYSQFADITSGTWQKVGCGITSLAMLIGYHTDSIVNVNNLLREGIDAHAYLTNVGWTYAGLIRVAHAHGLDGASHDLAHLATDAAFNLLTQALDRGPVIASVHYTFDPLNPIPHLVVVTAVKDGRLYYNDPAYGLPGDSITVEKFEKAWKKRYIEFWPTA